MEKRDNKGQKTPAEQRYEANNSGRNDAKKAHEEAEKDIENDAEFSAHSPNDDLDEGETARLGEEGGK